MVCLPSPVPLTCAGLQRVTAQQMIDQRRLAHARRPKQAIGLARHHELLHLLDALARHVAERDDPGRDACRADIGEHALQFRRTHQIRLGQQQHRLDMPLVDHHQVALQPAHIEIEMARLHDERHVDVRRDHLEIDVLAGRFAPQERPSGHDIMDARKRIRIVILHTHPIAYTRHIHGGCSGMKELARQLGRHFALFIADDIAPAIDSSYPGQALA